MLKMIRSLFHFNQRVAQLEKMNTELHSAICSLCKDASFGSELSSILPVEVLNSNSEKTLIVFGGMMSQPSMPPKEFFHSLPKGEFNVMFVKDFRQAWYTSGLLGVTSSFNDTLPYIQKRIPATTKQLVCMGTSSGGYAAIRFGILLRAKKVVAFAPQTYMDKTVFNTHGKPQTTKSILNDPCFDLAHYFSKDVATSVDIYYGDRNALDKKSAHSLAAHANLRPYPTRTHSIAKYLKESGELDRIIGELFV